MIRFIEQSLEIISLHYIIQRFEILHMAQY